MDYTKLTEEDLKSNVQQDFFKIYRYRQLGRIDFVIAKADVENGIYSLFENDDNLKSILWAEAKQGTKHDIFESFVQLILTIGKERTFEKYLPPKFIGAFDAEKFAFIEYNKIQEVFYQNDFNWNVTPSNHETKEFKQLHELCQSLLEENSILFHFETQSKELKEFINLNFKTTNEITEKIAVTKNNFTFVFQRWSEVVKPTISVDWQKANKAGIISADFFLADLLSENGESLKDSLYVVLKKTKYELAKKVDDMGLISVSSVGFNDKQKAYNEFWAIYSRPPKEEYWEYIIGRRDLLVPQDIRERKGSFFTPKIWVEKSQQYLAEVLGENWQDEYYIWDCCAGTGNLLNGLTNYDNVWASTLDKQDVDVMLDRINNGWGMPEDHIFQFDFLNDDFSKCPEELQEILKDDEKRKKLVIYINPPYAETDNRKSDRSGVKKSLIEEHYKDLLSNAGNELFAQFFIRIYKEIPNCILGQFSKLKHLQGTNFKTFRNVFTPKLKKMFIVPANTFDNVKGEFPIGFIIWDLKEYEKFQEFSSEVFDKDGKPLSNKIINSYETDKNMNEWIAKYKIDEKESIGLMNYTASDFQQRKYTAIMSGTKQMGHNSKILIDKNNIFYVSIYFAVRLNIPSSWLNDRDQFLYPNDNWKTDKTFQSNCLIYTLFHGQNQISSEQGDNHWIPFTREQFGCKKTLKSKFMSSFIKDFLDGKIDCSDSKKEETLFENQSVEVSTSSTTESEKNTLSKEAQDVYDSGLELWKYYHTQPNANPNASFYDIRKYFQGTNDKGKMNLSSNDEKYTELIGDLREKMKTLAKAIEPKVYEYGFLK